MIASGNLTAIARWLVSGFFNVLTWGLLVLSRLSRADWHKEKCLFIWQISTRHAGRLAHGILVDVSGLARSSLTLAPPDLVTGSGRGGSSQQCATFTEVDTTLPARPLPPQSCPDPRRRIRAVRIGTALLRRNRHLCSATTLSIIGIGGATRSIMISGLRCGSRIATSRLWDGWVLNENCFITNNSRRSIETFSNVLNTIVINIVTILSAMQNLVCINSYFQWWRIQKPNALVFYGIIMYRRLLVFTARFADFII